MPHMTPREKVSVPLKVFSPQAGVVSPSSTNKKEEITTCSSSSSDGLQLRNILEGPHLDSFYSAAQIKAKYPLYFGKYATKTLNLQYRIHIKLCKNEFSTSVMCGQQRAYVLAKDSAYGPGNDDYILDAVLLWSMNADYTTDASQASCFRRKKDFHGNTSTSLMYVLDKWTHLMRKSRISIQLQIPSGSKSANQMDVRMLTDQKTL
eukprot:2932575-Ditylum_brightwellii.AAC.1